MSPAPTAPARAAAAVGPQWWEGYPLAESIHVVVASIESGNWVEREIGALSASLDFLAVACDPAAMLRAWAVDWVIEHTPVLRQNLTELSGDPQRIAAHAQQWREVANTCHDQAAQTPHHLSDIAQWSGAAATEYRSHLKAMPDIFAAAAQAALGIAAATEFAGRLVATVRVLIRELISQLVARLAICAAAEGASLGLLTPVIAGQAVSFIASLTSRAVSLTEAMARSIVNLRALTTKLAQYLAELEETVLERTAVSRTKVAAEALTPAEAEAAIRTEILAQAKKVYPGWDPKNPLDQNCVNCVVALELRRRGIDATANALTESEFMFHGARPPGVIPKLFGREFIPASRGAEIEEAFQRFGPGSRGIVSIRWNKASAHVFSVENVNGHVTWVEPQTGELDVGSYFDQGTATKYMRVDDATYSPAAAKEFATVKSRWSR